MAEALIAISTAAANWVTTTVFSAGAPAWLASAAGNVAFYGTAIGIPLAISVASRPDLPSPEGAQISFKQTRPPRRRVIGEARVGLAGTLLFEAVENNFYLAGALCEGPVAGFGQVWLHDDAVTLDGSGFVQMLPDKRYPDDRVQILTRTGLETETAYAELIDELPALWTEDHRGDRIASLAMIARHAKLENFPADFPNGRPEPSQVVRGVAYDWRDPAQDRDDPDSWGFCSNPIVGLVHDLWAYYGQDWDIRFAPVLDELTEEADYCDELVDKVGGTEPRYACGGVFDLVNAPADVIARYLATCDGFFARRGDGAFIIRAGRYYAPTVTLDETCITGLSVQRFVEDENAVNELIVSLASPAHDYNEVETDAWRDETDIAARGVVRSQPLSLSWVQSNGQARRLAKRRMSQLSAPIRGTIRTNLYGLRALGERYLRVQVPDLAVMANIVVEVTGVEIDIVQMTLTFSFLAADPNIDEWNPATEEGPGPTSGDRAGSDALTAPTVIGTPVAFYESTGAGGDGVRIRIVASGPDRPDLSWQVRWRVEGGVSWVEAGSADLDPGAGVTLETGFVPADTLVEIEAAYTTGGGSLSPWSETETVDTSVIVPPPPEP